MANKIKQLFSLEAKHFLSGISPSAHLGNNGLFFKALGINPFVNPFVESIDVGLLQMSGNPTDITGGVVTDVITAGCSRVTAALSGNLYMIGDTGRLYDKDLSTDTAPSLLRTGSTIANAANGIEIFQSEEGVKYLYYFRTTKIGRWDFDGPTGTFVDDWDTGLNSTTYHPTHQFLGDVFFGNGAGIGRIYSVSGSGETTSTTSPNGLIFPADFTTTCLDDDGTFLVAGITKNLGENTLRSFTKVIYWDTFSGNFNKEWSIPDPTINAIKKFRNGHIAFCGRGLYYFDLYTKPQKIRTLDTAGAVRFGYPESADVLNDAIIWGGGSAGVINSYGKIIPESEDAYFQPIFNFGSGSPSFLDSSTRINRVYIGTAEPKFYTHTLSDNGGTTTTIPESVYIDLGDEVNITRIDIILGEPLATGDRFTLQYQTDEDNAASDYGVVEFDIHGTTRKVELFKEVRANQIKLLFNFRTGNVKIKRIRAYGYSTGY